MADNNIANNISDQNSQDSLPAASLKAAEYRKLKKEESDPQAAREKLRKTEEEGGKVYSLITRPERVAKLEADNLRKNQEILFLKIEKQKELNKIQNQSTSRSNYTQNDLNRDLKDTEDFYDRQIQKLIDSIQTNKDEILVLSENYFGLYNPKKDKKDKLSKEERKKLRLERKTLRKLNRRRNRDILKELWKNSNKLEALINIISYIAFIYLDKINVNNVKISNLVDEVNNEIQNISTPAGYTKAKISKNIALQTIALNRNLLLSINKLIEQIQFLPVVLSAILQVLYLLPPLLFNPKIEKFIKEIENFIKKTTILFRVISKLVNKYLINLDYQESRLLELSLILDGNTSDITAGTDNRPFGYLKGYDYKDFKFFLKKEENPNSKNVINGRVRSYAVATNRSGIEILKSEYSFTEDPDVLIEQLKLEIDKQNLVA